MMDPRVRDRIELLRFVMIFGVIVLHTPDYVAIGNVGSDWFSLTKAYFQNAMFRTTVPVLTCISGYLVFRANLDLVPKTLARKKARSLLLPFLAFNVPLVVLVYAAQALFGVETNYHLLPFHLGVWLDAAFGFLHSPINYPLNFLRDMIVLMCLAPLMGQLIRKAAFPGLILVAVLFLSNLDGPLVLRDTMPVLFYAGGLAAHRKWNLRALDAYAPACLLVFLLLCVGIVYLRIGNTTLLRLVSPVLVWPAGSLLFGTRFGNWCVRMNKYSFFMFIAHAPVLFGTWLVYKHVGHRLSYPAYWAIAPVLTTAILIATYRLANHLFPTAFGALLGGRGRKQDRLAPVPASVQAALARQDSTRYASSEDDEVNEVRLVR